jgi:hypothetical protein
MFAALPRPPVAGWEAWVVVVAMEVMEGTGYIAAGHSTLEGT